MHFPHMAIFVSNMQAFHTSRWDYAYTGGDPEGNLTSLADKRVAIS